MQAQVAYAQLCVFTNLVGSPQRKTRQDMGALKGYARSMIAYYNEQDMGGPPLITARVSVKKNLC